MEKKWITTEQMIEYLKNDGDEHEFNLLLGNGFVTSSHWIYYDPEKKKIAHTRDIHYDWYTEAEFLECYGDCQWRIYN